MVSLSPPVCCYSLSLVLTNCTQKSGDFVGTCSYTVHPRDPLGWLDPGVFGTLGVGGGFALGAKACRFYRTFLVFFSSASS